MRQYDRTGTVGEGVGGGEKGGEIGGVGHCVPSGDFPFEFNC
jgi:hypothetical protein